MTSLAPKRWAYAACIVAAATAAACASLMTAAILVPAPDPVVPLAVAVCIGCPLLMGWSLPRAVGTLRVLRTMEREHDHAVAALRRYLARLPETEHPLGR